ncbi:transmembrane protein 238, partial [Fukomys damarensis]|uniref:transmembrane protein 238 n=1 Tax=Fukomys damarensis TaxID=885580 RepID=UPI00053F51BF
MTHARAGLPRSRRRASPNIVFPLCARVGPNFPPFSPRPSRCYGDPALSPSPVGQWRSGGPGVLLRSWWCRQWQNMEPSRTSVDSKGKQPRLGRCKHFFWLGVVFDTVGVAVLFTGVFADLLFYDMLLYLGSIIIFLSLLWWISWYTGNIELLPEESSKRGSHMAAAPTAETLHQSVSHRFSWTIGSISNTFRIQRRHLRRSLKKRAILTMTVAGLEDESKGKDGRESVKDSVDSQEICKENLGPKPEDENNPEAIGS